MGAGLGRRGFSPLISVADESRLGVDQEAWAEWSKCFADFEVKQCSIAYRRLSCIEKALRHKLVAVVKGAAGSAFRIADSALDVRAACNFYALGHYWWAAFTCLFILSAPAAQYIVARTWLRDRAPLRFLVPFSCAHIIDEVSQVCFLTINKNKIKIK